MKLSSFELISIQIGPISCMWHGCFFYLLKCYSNFTFSNWESDRGLHFEMILGRQTKPDRMKGWRARNASNGSISTTLERKIDSRLAETTSSGGPRHISHFPKTFLRNEVRMIFSTFPQTLSEKFAEKGKSQFEANCAFVFHPKKLDWRKEGFNTVPQDAAFYDFTKL